MSRIVVNQIEDIAGTNPINVADIASSVDLASSGGASLVGYLPAGTGAVVRTVQAELRERVSVTQFAGVDPTGVADSTAGLQSALNSGAKLITSPSGATYKISDPLTLPAGVTLDLKRGELMLDDPSGAKSHIRVGWLVDRTTNQQIVNVTFSRAQVATGGYCVDAANTGILDVFGCRMYGNNKIFGGIRLQNSIIINIDGNYIDNVVSRGIFAIGSGLGADRTVDLSIRHNRIEGGLNAVQTSDFVEGVFLRDNIIFNTSGVGAVFGASSNANGLFSIKLQDNDFDTCAGGGVYLEHINNLQVTGNWFSSNGGDDLTIKETVDSAVVSANQMYPGGVGINAYGTAISVTGNLVAGGTTGVQLNTSTSGCLVADNILSGMQYGINLGSATSSKIKQNTIQGTTLGDITGNAGTGCAIVGNDDAAVGTTGFISVGASPFTYTTGARPEQVSIFGGTVTSIVVGGNAIGFTSDRDVFLPPGKSVTVTYSAAPFMVRVYQ